MARARISEFESSHPSHAVGLCRWEGRPLGSFATTALYSACSDLTRYLSALDKSLTPAPTLLRGTSHGHEISRGTLPATDHTPSRLQYDPWLRQKISWRVPGELSSVKQKTKRWCVSNWDTSEKVCSCIEFSRIRVPPICRVVRPTIRPGTILLHGARRLGNVFQVWYC